MYRVTKKNIEKKPAKAISWVTFAATSPFTRRITNGTRGLRLRNSLTANAPIRTADPASVEMVWAEPQPTTGARTSEYTSSDTPAVISTAPWVSNVEAWLLAPRSLGSSASAPATTRTQIGGFTKNTQRHPGPWASRPPKKTPNDR